MISVSYHGNFEMDYNFQAAIAMFETVQMFGHAAFCAASAADGWAFFGKEQRAVEYAKSAAQYVSLAGDTSYAREALQILNRLALT